MSQQKTETIDLTFLGTDNHRTTHGHLLTFAYRNLFEILKTKNQTNDSKEISGQKSFSKIADDEDTSFRENSPIQVRLFDGIGCKGTTKNPRPGNYTWNRPLSKLQLLC